MVKENIRVVLASASPRRRELLRLIFPDFEVVPSGFDESNVPSDMPPAEQVIYSAKRKAMDVMPIFECALIISADTVVSIDEHILGKPEDADDAKRMLRMLSGRVHQVYTGICCVDSSAPESILDASEKTDVKFRRLSEEMINRYIATGEPMDKAGAYAIQGKGSVLVEGINGCYFNVVGLPLYRLSRILEQFGIESL